LLSISFATTFLLDAVLSNTEKVRFVFQRADEPIFKTMMIILSRQLRFQIAVLLEEE